MSEAIKIQGLNEFVRKLKALDRDMPKVLRVSFNTAADSIVQDARPHVPHRSGKAAASIRTRSTQTAARVIGGGAKAPWYPWLDFGGRVGRRKRTYRPVVKEGRYIYEAYFRQRRSGRFEALMVNGLLDAARGAGIEVT